MTPADINNFARSKYNATGDSFFSDLEIYQYIYQAELELTVESECIEKLDSSTTTVSGTRVYNFLADCTAIKRIELIDLNGISVKLEKITFREDDALTLVNVASTTLGKPQFYETWNNQIYLRPIPDTTGYVLKQYYYGLPIVPTASSTLEVPSLFHMDLVDFVVKQMYSKDQNLPMAQYYDLIWQKASSKIKRWIQKRKRTDTFTVTMNEDNLAVTLTGPV